MTKILSLKGVNCKVFKSDAIVEKNLFCVSLTKHFSQRFAARRRNGKASSVISAKLNKKRENRT